ncbi:hypothetical protein CL634_04335 [bacterium]|nr:hypothetical protein [bacterium]|tara:strand:+ start:707 stop:1174 length:468 start_codon:yes stop_codon:yes gene_type:complete
MAKTSHKPGNDLDYDQITKYIYVGTNMCCQAGFAQELIDKGVTVDISLEQERIDSALGADFFIWIPVYDHTPPSQDQFEFGTSVIAKFVAMKRKMYIHCKMGHGRAPTLVVAYLVTTGMSVERAVAEVIDRRDGAHPNTKQVAALHKFAKKLGQK